MKIWIWLILLLAVYAQPEKKPVAETLTMDVWEPYAPDWAVQEFKNIIKKKYKKNIEVVVKYVYSPNEFYDRVRADETDIISPSHNLIRDDRFNFIGKQLVIPIDKKIVRNIRGVEPRFLKNEAVLEKKVLMGVPFATGSYSLLYKKAHFKHPPDSWKVLWDPRYRGRYAISKDFYESNIYITALAMGLPKKTIADIDKLNTEVFKHQLMTLLRHANYWQGVPHDKDVTRSILTTAWGLSHSVHDDKNKEWAFAYPKEGITLWTDYLLVTKAVKRSAFAETLAMEWINYSLSPSFQRRLTVDQLKCYSAVPEAYVEGRRLDPKEKEFLFQNAVYWPVLSERNRNGLKFMYEQAEERVTSMDKKAEASPDVKELEQK
ncbi:ABC transporter substrate-binding protein [Bdellovibrio sp. HCB337]|uniref:ABC transporter substrate-binding protein n=1 Tax=Bdellovibrio sp. HCB337 TaxID=3394358 RepID=UPI0039A68A92